MLSLLAAVFAFVSPATTRASVTPPPGFSRVAEVDGAAVYAEADDAAVVRTVLSTRKPATAPSTRPSDVLDALQSKRPAAKALLAKRIGWTDAAEIDAAIDTSLKPAVEKYRAVAPPAEYLLITAEKLKAALRGGWTNERYYYNRAADSVQFTPGLSLAEENPGPPTLLPVVVDTATASADRGEALVRVVNATEADIATAVSNRAMFAAQILWIDTLQKHFAALKLPPEQEWLATGIANVLSAELMHELIGVATEPLVVEMTMEASNAPFRSAAVNLIAPIKAEDLRPELAGAYKDAARRRATAVVYLWQTRGTDPDALPKLVASLRDKPTDTADALLARMKEINGVDVSAWVK